MPPSPVVRPPPPGNNSVIRTVALSRESEYVYTFRPPPPSAVFQTPAATPGHVNSRVSGQTSDEGTPVYIPTTSQSRRTAVSKLTVASTNNQTDLNFIASEHTVRSPDLSFESHESYQPVLELKQGAPPPSPLRNSPR